MTGVRALVVLDFSGTLSVAAARFSAPERLSAELERCGLAALGIDTPEVFWARLVNPTWRRGSMTRTGYVTVLTAAALDLLGERGQAADAKVVRDSVRRFADRYFAASTIAASWTPWLLRLVAQPDAVVMVATDHYAEATGHIIDQIAANGLTAAAMANATRAPAAQIVVANSADVGHHKTDRGFWDVVAQVVGAVDRVVVIDDFGANEQDADAYGMQEQVTRRRLTTTELLSATFSAPVTALPFVLDNCADAALRRRVDDAGGTTMSILSKAS